MLTSGKSGVSSARTSPMLMDWSRRETAGLTCAPRGVVSPAGDVAGASLGGTLGPALCGGPGSSDVDDEPELADLDLVAGDDGARVDALAVDVRAVEAADVADREGALLADELGVLARHRDVVQEDVARRVPADGGHVAVQQEPGPGVGAVVDPEQGGSGPQRGQGAGVDDGRARFGERVATLAHPDRGQPHGGRGGRLTSRRLRPPADLLPPLAHRPSPVLPAHGRRVPRVASHSPGPVPAGTATVQALSLPQSNPPPKAQCTGVSPSAPGRPRRPAASPPTRGRPGARRTSSRR